MQGNPSPRRYRALNVLEELDQPGEFVIDRGAGRLYLWPPADLKGAQITLATLDAPVVALEDASHITLRGFVVESGLDNGIEVRNGTECEIVACEVRNLRRLGIRVTGGTRHRVVSCDIHHTGQGGLVLGGGDRKTLTPAGHEAVDNHLWRFSEHQLTSAYGLSFEGVGNRAAHNLIHDAPHQAVFVGGNDHVFEFNEVHHVCTETDDCGALYKGRNPSCRGNLIRFNYWHDIGSPMGHGNAAVYFDDGDGGDTVFGNVFVRCGEPGRGSFGTVFSHGGHDNRAENNIFVDCKRALGSAPWDDARWRDALKGGQDCFFVEKLLHEVDITKPPYTTRYPELVGYLDPPAGVPRVNHARLNLLVRCGQVSGGNWRLEPRCELVDERRSGLRRWFQGRLPPAPRRPGVQAPPRIQADSLREDRAATQGPPAAMSGLTRDKRKAEIMSTMNQMTIPRRQFLGAVGAAVASVGTKALFAAQPAKDNIRLGMMLQGGSAAELQQKAKAIAAAGFDSVQLTFFFQPTAAELESLARALKDLKLKTVAFGTYFNLFRPDDTGFMGASQAAMKLVAAHAGLFDCTAVRHLERQLLAAVRRRGSAQPHARGRRATASRHPRGRPAGPRAHQRARRVRAVLPARRRHGGTGEGGAGAISRPPGRAGARPAQLHHARALSAARCRDAPPVSRTGRSHPPRPLQGPEAQSHRDRAWTCPAPAAAR